VLVKDQAPGTIILPDTSKRKPGRPKGTLTSDRHRLADGMKYKTRQNAGKIMAAKDVDPSLEATEKRIKLALGVTTQRLEEQALSGGLTTDGIDQLAKIAGVYRTLANTAAPFDPSKLSDADMERLIAHLDKAK
jgi:hypothetical protein